MVRDKALWKYRPVDRSRVTLFALNKTRQRYDESKLYGHEMDIADCFVALFKTGKLTHWQRKWDKEQVEYYGRKFSIYPDAIFQVEGLDQILFLEVDRGTMDPKEEIIPKLEKYVRYSKAHPDERFTVVFTAQGYRYEKEDEERRQALMPALAYMQRGNQFVCALHDDFLADPLGTVFHSPWNDPKNPLDPSAVCLLQL
jgi:hypothetical protein